MHFLILGASGRTGKLTTAAALQAGHTVTALVRNTDSLDPQPGLTIVEGTPLQQADLEDALRLAPAPVETIISTLNAARKSDSPFAVPLAPPMFVRHCVTNAIAAVKAAQSETKVKVVVMSAFGVGSSWAQLPWVMKALIAHSNMKAQFEDHDALDAELREGKHGDVDWLFVRPARLTDGPASAGVREFGEEGRGLGFFGSISRASVAEFLVRSAEGREGWQRAVVIGD